MNSTIRLPIVLLFAIVTLVTAVPLRAEVLLTCKGQKALGGGEAQKIQDRMQAAYGGVASLKAEFLQDSYLQALDISESSSGTVQFVKPGKMRWDYLEPEPQLFLFADQTMWFYQKEQNQVLIDAASDVLLSDLPISFLLGIGDIKRDFELITACSREEGVVLDLRPRQDSRQKNANKNGQELQGFQLLVDPKSALPVGARVVDVGGNVTTVLMRSLEVNQKVDPAIFSAKFPSGVDIQDRRKEGSSL